MKQTMKYVFGIPVVLAAVMVLAALPAVTREKAGNISFDWSGLRYYIQSYIENVANGKSFEFQVGRNVYSLFDQGLNYFMISLGYLAVSVFFGITFGLLLGLTLSRLRKGWVKEGLEVFSVLPDFIIIFLLQFAVVLVYQKTGFLIAKVASVNVSEPAMALPIFIMTFVPGLYLMRNVVVHTFQVITEDYVLFAKSKGLAKFYIYCRHVLPNVLPFVKADLHKLMGIMMGNLFIVEYLFNIKGMTSLLFSFDYQYPLVVNSFLQLIAIYLIIYGAARLYIHGIEKVFTHE